MEKEDPNIMRCPHCKERITNKQMATMVSPRGYIRRVLVEFPDGKRDALEFGGLNPDIIVD